MASTVMNTVATAVITRIQKHVIGQAVSVHTLFALMDIMMPNVTQSAQIASVRLVISALGRVIMAANRDGMVAPVFSNVARIAIDHLVTSSTVSVSMDVSTDFMVDIAPIYAPSTARMVQRVITKVGTVMMGALADFIVTTVPKYAAKIASMVPRVMTKMEIVQMAVLVVFMVKTVQKDAVDIVRMVPLVMMKLETVLLGASYGGLETNVPLISVS